MKKHTVLLRDAILRGVFETITGVKVRVEGLDTFGASLPIKLKGAHKADHGCNAELRFYRTATVLTVLRKDPLLPLATEVLSISIGETSEPRVEFRMNEPIGTPWTRICRTVIDMVDELYQMA